MADASDLTPHEWLERLGKKLRDRRVHVDRWRRYYEGNQDLPAGPSQHREAYSNFQKKARLNLCQLAAEAMVHRTQAIGFRDAKFKVPKGETDPVWQEWQRARLDSRQYGLWRTSFSRSTSYAIVGVHPKDTRRPRVTIEGPENVIVETDPADSSRRLAALRLWHDSILKQWMATLYLPGERHHWQTKKNYRRAEHLSFKPQVWEPRTAEPGRSFPDVPVFEFPNGDEGEIPRPAFEVGMDVQDRLNLTVLNRLTAERFGAFRQRGLTNFVPEEDPATGLAISPFNPGSQHLWTIGPPEAGEPEPKFFDFAQTDTTQMLRAVDADMRAFAAVTLTPVYYLPGDLVNIGADAIAALDAGHVAKIKQIEGQWAETAEAMLQMFADIAELDRNLSESEIVWQRPENLLLSQVADYATKMTAAGYPLPIVAERLGDSPQQVAQLRTEMAAEAARQAFSTSFGQQRPPEPNAFGRRPQPQPGEGRTDAA